MLYEGIVIIIATLVNFLVYRSVYGIGNKKQIFIGLILGTIPFLFFSVQMLGDTITADELQYMKVIVDMKNILETPEVATKLMLQYRTSQMVFGTFFSLIPRLIFDKMAFTDLIVLYKLLHWLLFYLIGLGIIYIVVKEYIVYTKEIWKQYISYLGVFAIVIGLPMSISLMKVCNYDASNIMFGTLGILLVGVEAINISKGIKNKLHENYSLLGVFICILGCLDKWSSGVYFIICAIIYVFTQIKKYQKNMFKVAFKQTALIIIFSLLISYLNLEYIRFVLSNGEIFSSIGFGHIAFSFTNLFFIMFEGVQASVSNNVLFYLLLLYLMITVFALLLKIFVDILVKSDVIRSIFNIITIMVTVVFVMTGIYAAYALPQMFGAYEPVSKGEYSSLTLWGEYHYGAYSWVGHKLSQIAYAFATILCNLPTTVLLLFIAYIIICIKHRAEKSYYSIAILASTSVIIIFACMDQPSDARYFGVCILLICLSCFVNVFNYALVPLDSGKVKKDVGKCIIVLITLWYAELMLYMPNVKIFAPIWYNHSQEWKETVRLGHWNAGEAMSWGEEMALAGRKIERIVKENNLNIDDITIYSNYGRVWLQNPGFTIESMIEVDNTTKFDDTTFFVFTKKSLFRSSNLPSFLEEIEPIAKIEYRGEICSWIYSGTQIKQYKTYFGV